jgi:hypothetical protein
MTTIKDGGPAFPARNFVIPNDLEARHVAALGATQGMTLRQYAAIKLRHPASGDEWLDDMILASLRNDFAAQVAHAHATGIAAADLGTPGKWHAEVARLAYMTADAMLAEREKAAQP